MTVTEAITASGITPSENFAGEIINDDFILAIKTEDTQTDVKNWVVCADHISSYAASLNPKTSDNTFMRTGTVSTKTGNQRKFSISGNRVIGDAFQDFCLRTGKGEKGKANIIVNNDADGNAGDAAGIKIDLNVTGKPAAYTYSAA